MSTLLPGTRVEARGLPWEVVHNEPAGDQHRLRLRCVQGDLQGMEIDLLHPFEPIRPIATDFEPQRAGRLPQWRLYHDAFLLEQALGPSALLAVQPGRLDIAPYQLVPVMRALRMSRPRLLLADGVGLGKTIEAGLVMAELIARRRAHRILIVSPAGPLLEQWHGEMRERFGLRFETVRDAGELQEIRRSLVLGANPFDHVSYCLTSVDFAKQEKVLQELERTAWDLVVLDEAHHCVRLGSAGDWEDSRRRRLAEVLARQTDGLLLLTATPHDGYDAHFASVVELLDPSLVDGRGALRGDRYREHVVRRLKEHVKDPVTGAPLFKTREVTPRAVPFDPNGHPAFSALQQALLAAVAPRLRQAVRQRRYGEVLAFVALLKRSVSTASACRNTLGVICDRYREITATRATEGETRRQRLRTLREYQRRLERYGTLSFEEEQDRAALEAEDMAAELAATGLEEIADRIDALTRSQRRERDRDKRIATTSDALDALVAVAEAALSEDPKLPAVLDEIVLIRGAEPAANILVYTEYTDSQDALVDYLRAAQAAGRLGGEVLADDAQTVRLLEGLADEEQTLFARPPRELRQIEIDSDDDVGSAAYLDLLAEVERAMAGYEKAAKTSAWLGEAGLNADARLVAEASQAREQGEHLGAVELLDFVCSALESDGGAVVGRDCHGAGATGDLELRLPPLWTHGLRDIPGFDTEARTLRLTTDRRRMSDAAGRRLGYLGRAHPMVRRALDRVRNLRFGESDAWLDRRVSAVAIEDPEPRSKRQHRGAIALGLD